MSALLAVGPQHISTPSVAYKALAPIFIVLGAALLGVLAEAVVPRRERFNVQVGIALVGLIGAVIWVGAIHGTSITTPSPAGNNIPFAGSLAIDPVGLFIQGTVLALAILSVLLMAERSVDVGSPIVASAAAVVGSPDDRRFSATGG